MDRPTAPSFPRPARTALLRIARDALDVAAAGGPADPLPALDLPPELLTPGAAFVTLIEDGELRACMGRLDPDAACWENVRAAARMAALEDPRFDPVAPRETARIELEVSVLGPFAELDDPSAFVPGEDGIVVERDGRRALLLPQVAAEHGLDGPGMLRAACRKAGLAPDAWRDRTTRLRVFAAAVISEREA